MLRKALYTLLTIMAVVILTLVIAYVYRTDITHRVAKHYLQHYNAELTCAQWQWGEQLLSIKAERLCLTVEGHSLTLEGISLTLAALDIDKASVVATRLSNTNNQDSQWQGAPLALLLPIKRPLLRIEDASITYPGLARPMRFSISEQRLNHFAVAGDIHGQWQLNEDAISVDINVEREFVAVLLAYIKSQYQAQQPWAVDVKQLAVTGKFWGNRVDAQVRTSAFVEFDSADECIWQANTHGTVLMRSADMQEYRLDANSLATQVNLAQCPELSTYTQHLGGLATAPWHVSAHEPIELNTQGDVKAKRLEVNTQSANDAMQAVLLEGNLNWQQLIYSSDYQIEAKLQKYGVVSSFGQLSNEAITGEFLGAFNLPDELGVELDSLHSEGRFTYRPNQSSNAAVKVTVGELSSQGVEARELRLDTQVALSSQGDITGQLNTRFDELVYNNIQLEGIKQSFNVAGALGSGRKSAAFQGVTDIAAIRTDAVQLSDVSVQSEVTINRVIEGAHAISWQAIEALLKHRIDKNSAPLSVTLNNTEVSAFTPIVAQLIPDLSLLAGSVSLTAHGDAKLQRFNWQAQLGDANVLYQNYLAKNLSAAPQGTWNSGQLHVQESMFTIYELRAGPVLSDIQGNVGLDSDAYIAQTQAQLMGGSMFLDKLYVTGLEQPHENALITLNGIDASKLIALEPQQGITISGILGAKLPVRLTQKGVSVENGRIYSEQAGKLTIDNNAAFNAVKAQQQQLGPMLSMLENLDIHDIQADVDLKNDGWLNMAMRIKGENPDHKQEVNFNYNHEENIYTLFKALRLSDEITQKVEQEYQSKE